MTLRLKIRKDRTNTYDVCVDGTLAYYVVRSNTSCDLIDLDSAVVKYTFYEWNLENKDSTEYKKMRAALVEYLAPKPEFTNEDYGRMADEERQKRMQAEAEIERLTADLARMVKQHEADKQTINAMALKYMEQENIKDQALLDAYALVNKKEAKRLSKRHRIDFKQAPSNKLPRTVTF